MARCSTTIDQRWARAGEDTLTVVMQNQTIQACPCLALYLASRRRSDGARTAIERVTSSQVPEPVRRCPSSWRGRSSPNNLRSSDRPAGSIRSRAMISGKIWMIGENKSDTSYSSLEICIFEYNCLRPSMGWAFLENWSIPLRLLTILECWASDTDRWYVAVKINQLLGLCRARRTHLVILQYF